MQLTISSINRNIQRSICDPKPDCGGSVNLAGKDERA